MRKKLDIWKVLEGITTFWIIVIWQILVYDFFIIYIKIKFFCYAETINVSKIPINFVGELQTNKIYRKYLFSVNGEEISPD